MASRGARYTLQVLLKLRDSLSKGVGKSIAQLRQLDRQVGKSQRAIDALQAKAAKRAKAPAAPKVKTPPPARATADAARAVRLEREQTRLALDRLRLRREESRLLQSDERARRAGARAAARPPARRVPAPGAWMRDSDRPPRWRDEREGEGTIPPRRRRGGPGRLERAGHMAGRGRDALYDFKDAYGQIREGIRGYTDPAADLMRARARVGTLGLSEQEAARADEAIRKTVDAIPGARLSEVTQAFAELYEVFASVEDTVRNLPRAAQYSFALKTLHGDRYSPEQLITQTKSAYKFADLVGLTKPDARGQVDHARVDEYHDRLMQVLSATGGDVDPREMLQAAKIGGTSMMGMSREGLTHLAALASDVGGSRAGNMQRSLLQSFVGGKLYPRHMKRLDELGMLDESKVLRKTGGKFELLPGAVKGAETISTDPLVFVDKMAEAFRRKGVDTTNEAQVVNAVAGVTGNVLSQQALAQLIVRRGEVTRFDELVAQAEALGPMFGRAKGMPLGKIEDAKARAENYRATVGGPMLETGGAFSEHLAAFYKGLQSFAEGNPTMSAALAGITSLGGASLSAGEGVGNLAGLINELRGGGGGIYGTGVGVGDAVLGGLWGAGRFGKGAARAGLAGATAFGGSAAAPFVGAGLSLAAAGVGLYTRHQAGRAGEGADRAASELYASTKKLREAAGGRLPDEVAKGLGASTFAQLNRAGDLTTKIDPGLYGAYQRLYDPSPYRGWLSGFDEQRAAGVFRQRAPWLQYPEAMQGFVADVHRRRQAGEIGPEAAGRTLKAAQAAFPESFKTASDALAQSFQAFNAAAQPAAQTFAGMLPPAQLLTQGFMDLHGQASPLQQALRGAGVEADRLPGAFGRVAGAADTLAAHISAIKIEVPAPVVTPAPGPPLPGPRISLIPPSASGSVVQRDGLVSAHRGNVIWPARLSRRSPGDWLRGAEAVSPGREGRDRFTADDFAAADSYKFESRGGAGVTIYAPLTLTVQGGADAGTVSQLRAEMRQHAAHIENLVKEQTEPRRVLRGVKRRLMAEGMGEE